MAASETRLSSRQAYLAMFEFLRRHYERGPTDEIGGLLGGLSLLADGGTAIPPVARVGGRSRRSSPRSDRDGVIARPISAS